MFPFLAHSSFVWSETPVRLMDNLHVFYDIRAFTLVSLSVRFIMFYGLQHCFLIQWHFIWQLSLATSCWPSELINLRRAVNSALLHIMRFCELKENIFDALSNAYKPTYDWKAWAEKSWKIGTSGSIAVPAATPNGLIAEWCELSDKIMALYLVLE